MGRKKWNRLTEEGKDKIRDKITNLYMKLTDIENDYEKIYDLEEAVNDNIRDLFECDQDCESCTELDRARCLHNFRQANVFYLQKLRSYEGMISEFIEYMVMFIQQLHKSLLDDDFEENEEDIENENDSPNTQIYS